MMLESLRGLLRIESVAYVDCSEDAPYGAGPARALHYMLDLCKSLGFRVKNCDNKTGWAEIGEGDEMVGFLCHLDVVPAGDGWDYPPFDLTLEEGRAYGRGVVDDKGATMCCVYAMKDLLDSGVVLKRRVRLIFGLSEECGAWPDMEYYKQHEELPVYGVTPDADYPAIYGEKGILSVALRLPLAKSGLVHAAGGTVSNAVPDFAQAEYRAKDGSIVSLQARGVAAHGSMPEEGKNAIAALMEQLAVAADLHSPFVDFFQQHIGWDYSGGKMGCALEDDKSGKLTLNAGVLKVEGEDLVLEVNVRVPVTYGMDAVLAPMETAAKPYGITVEMQEKKDPVYMDKNGPVITALLEIYRQETGDYVSEPKVIGGGTYARAMENIVAFGPMLPGRELTEHMRNEYMLVEDLYLSRRIYRKAMEQLANAE